MAAFSLSELLEKAGKRMVGALAEGLVPHRGEQGAARESVVRDFLRSNLPSRFDVSSGFVFDADGAVSDQLDIIVADATITPRFEVSGGVRFYPCESVVAVGQVKTHCDSRRKAWDAFHNLRSASKLDRSAGGRALCDRSGVPIRHTDDHLDRIFTFLFIIDKALEPQVMLDVVLEWIMRCPSHEWPNIILALDRYLMTYACDDGVCPNTVHARGVSLSRQDEGNSVLLQFYVLLSQAVVSTRVARVSSWHHLKKQAAFNADIFYSTTDDPPPYLGALNGAIDLSLEFPDGDDE